MRSSKYMLIAKVIVDFVLTIFIPVFCILTTCNNIVVLQDR